LPRMVLPLDERVLINVTDTNDIFCYRDTNGDGVHDEKVKFYEGGPRGGNLEHQPSGLIWSMDNRMYMAGNAYSLRFNNGTPIKESTASNGGQWGCAQDNFGKVWFSNGGGEKSFLNFQTHIQYAAIAAPEQMAAGFMTVWPLVPIPDVQGGNSRFRPVEKTLNHFTASCGHEIFRGDRLPADLNGDALIGEPVGRLIRRAKVKVTEGITQLSNPYEQSEFIRSKDPNFRPVNMTTGPDGCLYIVDMYRGIIQEGNWTREGSYLRKVIKQYGLEKNFGRGRIWRLVHKDFKPGPQPRMLEETPAQLVKHLEHPNGWWRDTAQKLLVLKGDASVAPALKELAKSHANIYTRMHALWTLDGLNATDAAFVLERLKDSDPAMRAAALRVSETLVAKGDTTLPAAIKELTKDSEATVALQALMTQRFLKLPDAAADLQTAAESHPAKGVQTISKLLMNAGKPEATASMSPEEKKSFARGSEIYKELCFGCHGNDGKGMPLVGAPKGTLMAPPLSGSKTVLGHKDAIVAVLLHGMSGPVNGKTYDAQMVAMNTNPDGWIADISSYTRNSFGNRGSFVTNEDVKRLRAAFKDRKEPWTAETLAAHIPKPLTNTKDWKLSASHNPKSLQACIDEKADTRYDTAAQQAPGMWFQVELPETSRLRGIKLDAGNSPNDYPRGYRVEVSMDGKQWNSPVAEGKGNGPLTEIDLPPTEAKFLRITQTGKAPGLFWSIHEMQILGEAVAGKK
jgi:mono/diheme cytochrome c family protein